MVATAALSAHEVFCAEKVWIDVLVFAALVIVHVIANRTSPGLDDANESEKAQSFALVQTIAGVGVTAVGILLPLSLAAIGTFASKQSTPTSVLTNVFVGDVWLALSLTLGLVVLWTAGFQGIRRNVQNVALVRFLGGAQLFALVLGIVRLLIATFVLVQSQS